MRRRLLLVSSSRVAGTGYLDHCEQALRSQFEGAGRVLFVPWALHDHDGYAGMARKRFAALGLELDSIHASADPRRAVEDAGGMFIGGGNSFRLLNTLHVSGVIPLIRDRVAAGMPYMGTSAGSNVACPTICTTNDMPIVYPPSFEALRLVPFQINPHYLDPDPTSTHQGETRETRIREYHEEQSTVVIGLREGTYLEVDSQQMTLRGAPGARLFIRDQPACELDADANLSHLLS